MKKIASIFFCLVLLLAGTVGLAGAETVLKQSQTASPLVFLLVSSTDHIAAVTGATVTVTLSKNGGSFASPSGAVSEIANGWYKVAGNATDEGTLGPLLLHATASGADPVDREYMIVAYDPQDSQRIGLSALPSSSTLAVNPTLASATMADGNLLYSSTASGTAQGAAGGAGSYIFLASSASPTNGIYVDWWIYTTGGTGAGQMREVINYVGGSTKQAFVATPWVTTPSTDTTYVLIPAARTDIGMIAGNQTFAPGTSGGLVIAGANAATTFATLTSTGAFTINGTSDVAQTGDSFSRIGANGASLTALGDARIGNLDAAVSSRSTYAGGAVASVTGNVGGNVVGSVGSVTGNVGGNVVGSVASVVGSVASVTSGVNVAQWGGVNVTGMPLPTGSYTTPPTTSQIAAAILATPANLLTTDAAGKVTFNNTSLATVTTTTNLTNLPAIPANWITASGVTAGALNGKGDWLLSSSYASPDNADIQSLVKSGSVVGSDFVFSANALQNAPAGGGGSGGFTGSKQCTLTFQDSGGHAVPNVVFSVVGTGTAATGGTGSITVGLNAGTYTLTAVPQSGTMWTSTTITVSSSASQSFLIPGTAATIPSPSNPAGCTVAFKVLNQDGTPASGKVISFTLATPPSGTGQAYLTVGQHALQGTASSDGTVQVELPQGSVWNVSAPNVKPIAMTIPNTTTYAPPNMKL